MVYTSEKTQGQVYIPAVNWACTYSHTQTMLRSLTRLWHSPVMVVIIIVVAAFKNTTNLTNAYGYACEM